MNEHSRFESNQRPAQVEAERQRALVQEQFGRTARAYVTSTIHANPRALADIMELIQPQQTWVALDVATGGGHVAKALATEVRHVVATDITPQMLNEARHHISTQAGHRNVMYVLADAQQLPFLDATFDVVTCRIAPHHFPNPEQFVQEAARVLKPGGRFLIVDNVVPDNEELADWYNTLERLRDLSHVRCAPVKEWVQWIGQAGLDIITDGLSRKVFEFESWCRRMVTSDEQFHEVERFLRTASAESKDVFRVLETADSVQSFEGLEWLGLAAKPVEGGNSGPIRTREGLRRLTLADEGQLEQLVAQVGWGLAPGRLRALLTAGRGFGRFEHGQLIGTGILFPYGTKLSFLGMLIVHPNWRRQGIGKALVERCLSEAVNLGVDAVGLLSTDLGRPLYESCGFATVDVAHRYIGLPKQSELEADLTRLAALQSIDISPLTKDDWSEVVSLDSMVSGADRHGMYQSFRDTVSTALIARDSDGQVCGFAMATEVGERESSLRLMGPVHAVNLETALLLTGHLMRGANSRVRLDVPAAGQTKEAFMKQLEGWGLVDTHVSPLMLHGATEFPGQRERLYGIADAALG